MATEARGGPLSVRRQIGDTHSVAGGHAVDPARNGFNERVQEAGSGLHIGFFDDLDHSELRRPVDGHELVELAFGDSDLGQVDVEEADRIAVDLPSRQAYRLAHRADGWCRDAPGSRAVKSG